MADRLRDKVAIISGGAGGIGAATGLLFAEEGARIVLVDRDAEAMATVSADIRAAVPGAALLDLALDTAEEAAAAHIVAETRRAFGCIDILVNNAGIRAYEALAEAKAETWRRIIGVNLLSHAWLTREALPDLRATRGSVVNVASTHAVNPRAGMGQYDATKAAIVSLTKTLAFEEAPHGVRVNAICPGATLTPFHVRRFAPQGHTRETLEAERLPGCLLERWAAPREIAFPILWLASEEASYVTAAVLMADGGMRVL
jgi:NAD(P)-dependent dehydrogenase (short-subunit alcohol dehydrogenase family)